MVFNQAVPEEHHGRREQMAEQAEMLLKLAAKMKQNITTGDRRKHIFKKYTDCFTGMEAVDWMLEHMEAKSVAEAVRKGQGLLSSRFIEKVDKETKFEYSRKRFYRFTPTTPEIVHAPEHPMPNPSLDIPLSAPARRRALAALIGAFVADAASTALNGVSRPEKTIPNLLRADFDPAFCGATDSGAFGFFAKTPNQMESSTGFEARVILQAIASRGQVNGAQLAKDVYWGFKNNKRMLSSTSRSFIKRIQAGKTWPQSGVKCRSIDVLAIIPIIVALYAGTDALFTKVDEVVKVFYVGHRVRDAALVAAFVLEQVILGATVLQAMRMSIRTERLTVKQRKVIFKAFTKSELTSYEAIQKFGNKGSLPTGFCGVLQPLFVLNDFTTAVRENIIGGGRTCRRAMFIGACFAAQDGLEAIPEEWVKKTPYFDFIETDSSMLVSRREVQASYYDDRSSETTSKRSFNRSGSTPYVDYTPNTVLTASLLRAAQEQRYGRKRSNSMESGASTPRSVASNFSYASASTNASSVADFGDMSQFYTKAKSPRSAEVADEMLQFYEQNYGKQANRSKSMSGRGSMGGRESFGGRQSMSARNFARSSVSTARSSDSLRFSAGARIPGSRTSDTTFFQSNIGDFTNLRKSQPTTSTRMSDASRHQFYGRASMAKEGPLEMGDLEVDPVDMASDDVVYAPRISLSAGMEQRVSMHAIL
ncbi:hypothetical protein Poli38472_000231 [Pythium oligandrum]|uniref:DEP domain-containing protein n=1 Tax=Pythium oligandrum TaxID=41045 RepID=A0A8K1CBA1_PYTOL|nr:hypothetical protein Poli38472_000231 [Pythium oligandrum]|eukprot:TMW60189.1 hypothetical protein Poli38472_000231 [Pythium oligandrum]